jgi:phospholipase/lecithinase/hemolysin
MAMFETGSPGFSGFASLFAPGTAPGEAQFAPKSQYSAMYAFGDSLSDAGNDYILSLGFLPASPPYSDGRFSNGPTWVQDLAKDLGLKNMTPSLAGGNDFAYGGAETGQDPLHTLVPIDLPGQLTEFLAQVGGAPSTALYTLSIGANDAIDAIGEYATNQTVATQDITTAVSNELTFISELALDGAKNFVIMNVPDLGKTPEEAGDAAVATQLSQLYDTDLSSGLTTLENQYGLHVDLVNAFQLIDDAVADPAKYGLKNVTTPVWTGNYEGTDGKLNAHGKAAQDTYLFFDHLHPTETGHLALAALALQGL